MTFLTTKGTTISLSKLSDGSLYLKATHRMLWFRDENPELNIYTEVLKLPNKDSQDALVRASITKTMAFGENNHAISVSTAHKREFQTNSKYDPVETAETGAIARALSNLGYSTAGAMAKAGLTDKMVDEHVENGVVDAPIRQTELPPTEAELNEVLNTPAAQSIMNTFKARPTTTADTDFVIQTLKKYKGQKVSTINKQDLASYLKFFAGKEVKEPMAGELTRVKDYLAK